jgi:hypothetical protein
MAMSLHVEVANVDDLQAHIKYLQSVRRKWSKASRPKRSNQNQLSKLPTLALLGELRARMLERRMEVRLEPCQFVPDAAAEHRRKIAAAAAAEHRSRKVRAKAATATRGAAKPLNGATNHH